MPDTIAAIATGHAPSAIGILRLSGPGTLLRAGRGVPAPKTASLPPPSVPAPWCWAT